jgi:hypothetical protein
MSSSSEPEDVNEEDEIVCQDPIFNEESRQHISEPLDQRIAKTLEAAVDNSANSDSDADTTTTTNNNKNNNDNTTPPALTSSIPKYLSNTSATDTDEDHGYSPVPDPSISLSRNNSTTLTTTNKVINNPSVPVPVNLSQNFELSLSTNEQLYHLLKDAHLANERLTARVHELERANKALVAAAQQQATAIASPSLGPKSSPSFHSASPSVNGGVGNSGGSGGVALSTLVAERDAALSEMEVLESRAREAEKNADNMVDAMRQANDALSADLREAQSSLSESEELVKQLRKEIEKQDKKINNGRMIVENAKIEVSQMKVDVVEAEETARKATTRAQRLESQSLDLKRRLNQLAQDLVASENDLKVTVSNKIRLEQNVVGLRKEIKNLRSNVQTLKKNCEREKLAKTEAVNRLHAERKNRRREHESSTRRYVVLF